MDLNMPVLNGIDAFKQYRSSLGDRAPTPVVALTADATTEAADRCEEVGFQACATKPIKPEDLLELISKVVARSLIESESPTLVPEPVHANGNHYGPTGDDTVRRETLRKLEQLGGRHFVEELIEQFSNDGQHMLYCLQLAFAETNAAEFDDQLHAMRSAAGNIGAESLYRTCLSLRRITREDLEAKGERHLQRLTAEFERVRQELTDYLAGAAAAQDLVSGPV
jgi:two-component system sensor histidine kinase RpfC